MAPSLNGVTVEELLKAVGQLLLAKVYELPRAIYP